MTTEPIARPATLQWAIEAPPAPVAFLAEAEDMGITNRVRLPFIRDPEGGVGWIARSLRLRPRVEEHA